MHAEFAFGIRSVAKLGECHPDLRRVAMRAIAMSPIDFAIVCGHRSEADQNVAFEKGFSKTRWPNSRHNSTPSEAFDFAPMLDGVIPWTDHGTWYQVAGVIRAAARIEGVEIRYGGDWDGDGATSDNKFNDLGHIELVDKASVLNRAA